MIINQQAFFMHTVRTKISDAQIKKHSRDSRVRQLKDERGPIYLRFNKPRTGGTWILMEYRNGHQKAHRIGKWPLVPAKHIMDIAAKARMQLMDSEAAEYASFETVDQLINWYVSRELKLNNSSRARLRNIKSMGEQKLCYFFDGVPIQQIDHQLVDKTLIQPLFNQGYSVSYVRANFQLLKSAYSKAKRFKHITVNPLADVKFKDFFGETFSVSSAQVRGCRLPTDKVPELLRKASDLPTMQRMLITMMISHGTRIGETRKARWAHIDLHRRVWSIPMENTKNGKAIDYPLTADMVELLRSYQQWMHALGYKKSRFLFPANKQDTKPVHAQVASNWIQQVSGKAWSSHDMRKRARSVWQELGIDYIFCELLLNHSRDMLDQAYMHSHVALQKKNALETYHEWLKSCWLNFLSPVSVETTIAA